jgi:NADH-quinone oxidoreductase subunit E
VTVRGPDRPRSPADLRTLAKETELSSDDLEDILEKYPPQPRYLIALLQDIQAAYRYLPAEAIARVCEYLGTPPIHAWAAATFYKSFSLSPRGEHEIKVCLGTACHLRGGARLAESLERELDVRAGETTADMKFTLETVNCLGACALAPVVMIDQDYRGNATPGSLRRHLKQLG